MRMDNEIMLRAFDYSDAGGVMVGTWTDEQPLFAGKEDKTGFLVYASYAAARRTSSVFHVRNEAEITQHHSILFAGNEYLITNISEKTMDMLELSAIKVEYLACSAIRMEEHEGEYKSAEYTPREVWRFPAILAEKYIGFKQEEPMARSETDFLLITPKPVLLEVHDIVKIGSFLSEGETDERPAFVVKKCHMLDEYKNQYEITHEEDV